MQEAYEKAVKDFLDCYQLSQYYDVFIIEGFDTMDSVMEITEEDMIFMNIKRGHRRLIQRGIATIKGIPQNQALDMIIPNNSEGTRSYGSSGYESLVIGSNNALSNTSNEEDSPPKRKYQRRPKPDTNAPTKPPSAYVAFSNATRPKLKHLKFEEISRKVGELWKHLSKHDRQSYERNAMIARDEYQARLEEYKQTKEYEAYKNYLNRFKKTKKRSSPDGSLGDISSNGMGSSNSSGSISSISSISSSGDNPTDPRMRGLIPVEFNHEW